MTLSIEELLLFNYMRIVSVSSYEETENVYQEILAASERASNSQPCVTTAISSINEVIKQYDLEIVEAVDDVSWKKIHCLISTNSNALAEKATFYDKCTCELLSKVIKECVTSDEGYISEISCLNVTTSMKANKSNLQSSLERLIKDKWLVSQNGKISLGMRCQLELEVAIKKEYPNYIKYCSLCRGLLMQGHTCFQCESHVHHHCRARFYKMNELPSTSSMCPICKEDGNETPTEDMSLVLDDSSEPMDPPAKRSRISTQVSP